MVKAFDALRCECYRLEDNIGAVASSKTPPSDLEQAMCTVIWAADRVEVGRRAREGGVGEVPAPVS